LSYFETVQCNFVMTFFNVYLADCIVRKKRVSFSERLVQERSFRPNSSILGQKKKNQRRSRNKLKKKASSEESLNTDDDGSKRDSSEEVQVGAGYHLFC
uniref:Ion_trans domain-containing protein n=1 Tax=Anisakis simplex TaxID=6269 RepID=A0A0M3JCD8_ANISI